MENINISYLQNNFLKIKYTDLKTDFLNIKNNHIGKPLTMSEMQNIEYEYKQLFSFFDLNDLQWRLTMGENSIIFSPIRKIDAYAIIGIINS